MNNPSFDEELSKLEKRIEALEEKCVHCRGRGWWDDGTGPHYTCSWCNGTGKQKNKPDSR